MLTEVRTRASLAGTRWAQVYHRRVTNILLATDSDELTNEIEAAVDGLCILYRVKAGVKVISAITEIDPAVVLLDLRIGNMGGIATCLAVRQREERGDLRPRRILLLLDRDVDVFLAREAGADGWLVKPIEALSTRRAVKDALTVTAAEPTQ